MKTLVLLTLAATTTTLAFAQEQGRVLSVTPLTQQVAVPQQVCTDQPVAVAPRSTGAGAVIGALAGGVLGNAIGSGGGRAAATAASAVGGALLGNQVEASGPAQYQTVRQCSTQNYYRSQTTGYNVVYEYRGRNYTTQTATPPGDWIELTVQPSSSYAPPQTAYNPAYDSGYGADYGYPQYSQPPVAPYPAQPVYTAPGYSAADYVAPVLIGAAIGAGAYYATRPHYYYRPSWGGHRWHR